MSFRGGRGGGRGGSRGGFGSRGAPQQFGPPERILG